MKIGLYFNNGVQNGPGKVVENLIKGLNINNIDYNINEDGDKNLILQGCERLNGDLSNCFLGPNICTLPIDNEILLNYNSYHKIVVPSEWVKKLYMRWIPDHKIKIWPVGIDTEKFNDFNFEKEYEYLIYFKRRNRNDLNFIINELSKLNKSYKLVEYGNYKECDFIEIISKSKFGIIIDSCESQGIAIQEMMSSNLPLLVWDVREWIDRGIEHRCDATSIPYWDSMCGEIFYEKNEFLDKLKYFETKNYNPRKFILENLSIEKIINLNE